MAIYDNLPVFKDTYDLLLQIMRLSMNLQRDFRYTIGERLKIEIIDLCVYIYKANGTYEKQEFIERARERMVVIKIQVRVLHDMKQISVKQFAMLADKMESVSKQLASWEKYLKKVNSENKGNTGNTDNLK